MEIIDVDDPSTDTIPDIESLGWARVLPRTYTPPMQPMIAVSRAPTDTSEVIEISDSGDEDNTTSRASYSGSSKKHPTPSQVATAGPSQIVPATTASTSQKRPHVTASKLANISAAEFAKSLGLPPGAKIGPPKKGKQSRSQSRASTGRAKGKTKVVKRCPSPIVLTSDDEDKKKVLSIIEDIRDEPKASDVVMGTIESEGEDDEDYETSHAGYAINDSSIWRSVKLGNNSVNTHEMRDTALDIATAARTVSDSGAKALKRYKAARHIATRTQFLPRRYAADQAAPFASDKWAWTKLQKSIGNTSLVVCMDRFDSRRRLSIRHGPLSRFTSLSTTVHKRFSPGPVNNISQSKGLIAISSCVLNADPEDDGSRIYNQDASLKLMYDKEVISLSGHCDETPRGRKHFTVCEARFDPMRPYRLVSCGRDGQVIMWDCSQVKNHRPPRITKRFRYENDRFPLGVSFKPDSSVFVTWDSKGHLRMHANDPSVYSDRLASSIHDRQPIQSLAWGCGSTDKMVFTTTASEIWNNYSGFHNAFDVENASLLYAIPNDSAGECLDVNSSGNELALVTCGEEQRFELSIYDIRSGFCRGKARHVQLSKLPRWYEETEENKEDTSINKFPSSINQVSYSPDGVYIAAARSDNTISIYDSRYLTKLLHCFRHNHATEGTFDDAKYGVYCMEWMNDPNTKRLSLVSGGADGCVRLWDVGVGRNRLRPNGAVICQSEAYISWFSMGDPALGEKVIVLGDGSGSIVSRGVDHNN